MGGLSGITGLEDPLGNKTDTLYVPPNPTTQVLSHFSWHGIPGGQVKPTEHGHELKSETNRQSQPPSKQLSRDVE
ncbi:hypothetical protein KQX54_006987 [Cotesia glomerata]|uniref:Uncharacterized protein n=1 Tax=Cotesia glomerata TaxID=32391 RepID=A0AAV7HI95_COTGL|nr:hypothetical protein KQX54_006987 [Cotesia glomerata]